MRRWTALKSESIPCFVKTHRNLTEVLTDHKLAPLVAHRKFCLLPSLIEPHWKAEGRVSQRGYSCAGD